MKRAVASLLACAPLLVWAACDDSDEQEPTVFPNGTGGDVGSGGSGADGGAVVGGGGSGGGGGGGAGGVWEPCDLNTESGDGNAECQTFAMPADRDDDSLGTVNVFVKRVAATEARRGSLWLLYGGPGGSGVGWEQFVPFIQQMVPDLDIMIPDHRGTGRSDRLECPTQQDPGSEDSWQVSEAEMPDCIDSLTTQWGDRLATFNGTQAAHDVGELIQMTREADDEAYVYGLSYGSQWGHRYMQLFPDQATGVSLEAICVPQCYFTMMDAWFDDVGQRYLAKCGQDAFCSSKLGADPWATAGTMYQNLATCTGLDPRLDVSAFQRILANLMYFHPDRNLVPAIIYRANRCSAADVNALNHLANFFLAPLPAEPWLAARYDSDLLAFNLGLVDNMPVNPPDLATLEAELATRRFGLGSSVTFRKLLDIWPLYPKDQYHGTFATTHPPLLMIHGELDFIPTADAQAAADALTDADFTFAPIPLAPHGASFQSPTNAGGLCGADILNQFWLDPTATLDTSCTTNLVQLSFATNPNSSMAVFGTNDAYEGDPGPPAMAITPVDPEVAQRMQKIRERIQRRMPL